MKESGSSEFRVITLSTAVAVVVANMVGTGVFGSLGFQVAGIPSGFPIMMLWLLGGLISFCGAVCYAELAAMMPRSGGEYHLLREAWHPVIGFISGWISATVGFAAPVALNAHLLGKYLGSIFEVQPLWFSIPAVVAVSLIHLGSLANISRFQTVFTGGKVLLILILGVAAFAIGTGQPVSFLPRSGDGELIASESFAISLVFVLYAYTGWNAAAYITGELRNPQRNLPLALLIGTGIVTILYVFINAAFLYSTPIDKMANNPEVGLIAAREIFGERGGALMGLLIAFGLISTISSMTWAGPRVAATMGEDYRIFSWLARRNRFGVPAWAILIQTGIVLILVISATFEQLLQYIQALLTLSSMMTVLAVIWMRFRKPGIERPYRAWGYPATPVIFLMVSGYVLFFQVKGKTSEVMWGLLTVALGVVVYAISVTAFRPRKQP